MIVENNYFEDIQRIWKENNNGFIPLYEFEEIENNCISKHLMMRK